MLIAKAAAQSGVADTTVKITIVATGAIIPTPLIIDIMGRNGKFKIAYTVVDSVIFDAFRNDPVHQEIKPNTRYFISPFVDISLRNSIKRLDTIATTDIVLRDAFNEVVKLNGGNHTKIDTLRPEVLHGHYVYLEITTNAGTKRIITFAPGPNFDVLIYNLCIKALLYTAKSILR